MTLASLLGPNWRTTLFGSSTAVLGYLTANPQMLGAVIPPEPAKQITGVCALLMGVLTAAHMKDRQVSGNGTAADPTRVAQDGRSVPIVPILLLCALLPFVLPGCAGTQRAATQATTQADQVFRSNVESVTVGANGGTIHFRDTAPAPVNKDGKTVRPLSRIEPSAGEWRWEADGWIWTPLPRRLHVVSFRSTAAIHRGSHDAAEASWQHTLYHGDPPRQILPLIVTR